MSVHHQLFVDPGHRDVTAACEAVVAAVGGRFLDNASGTGLAMSLDVYGTRAYAIGPVWPNEPIEPVDPGDPTDHEIVDGLPLLWSMVITPSEDDAVCRRVADYVFRGVAASGLGWPMVLTYNFGELLETYDTVRGVRAFPLGTRSDGVDEVLWR